LTPVAAGRVTGTHVRCYLSTIGMLMTYARCARSTLSWIRISICKQHNIRYLSIRRFRLLIRVAISSAETEDHRLLQEIQLSPTNPARCICAICNGVADQRKTPLPWLRRIWSFYVKGCRHK